MERGSLVEGGVTLMETRGRRNGMKCEGGAKEDNNWNMKRFLANIFFNM